VPIAGQPAHYKAEGAITLLHVRTDITFKIKDGANKETAWQAALLRSNEQLDVHIGLTQPINPHIQDGTSYVKEAFTLQLTGIYNGDEAQNLDLRINKDGTALSAGELNDLTPIIKKEGVAFTAIQKEGNKITGFKSGTKAKEKEEYSITLTPRPNHKDDGRYVFTFRSAAGDVQKQSIVWVDTKAPDLTPRVPVDGQALKEEPKLFAVVTDTPGAGIKTVAAVLNGNGAIVLEQKGSSIESKTSLHLQEGQNDIAFTYTDNLGNSDSKTISFQYDKTPPELSDIKIDGKDSDTVLIGTEDGNKMKSFSVTGNVQDAISLKAVYLTITNKKTNQGIGLLKQTVTGNTLQSFSWTVEHSMLAGIASAEGVYTISIRAEDKAGLTTTVVRTFEVDKDKPEVTVKTPAAGSTVNKTIVISGTASDKQKLKSVQVVKKDSPTTELEGVTESNGDASNKAVFTGDKAASWSFKLDTTKYVPISAGNTGTGSIVLNVITEDEVGNRTEQEHTITIDQHQDRPVITINSFEHIAPEHANLAGTRILTGKVEDDDGIVDLSTMKIGIDAHTPVSPIFANGVWKYTIPDGIQDNSHELHFTVTDNQGTVFTTNAQLPTASGGTRPATDFDHPYVLGYEDAKDKARSSGITFRLDTVQPEFKENGITFVLANTYTDSNTAVLTANTILGNKEHQTASFKVLVKDASGIKKVSMRLGNTSTIINGIRNQSFDAGDFEAWLFENITLTKGEKSFVITATDKADFDKTWRETVLIDFEPPVAEVRSSILDAVYYLNADIVGTVTDKGTNGIQSPAGVSGVSGIKEGSIEYKIGNSDWIADKHTVSGSDLSTLKQNPGTWEINIPDVTKYKENLGATPPADTTSKIYTIPVQVRMKDRAGNQGESQQYLLKFDPAGSTPIVELITPDTDAVLGTSVVISGLARTAKAGLSHFVKKLEVQLRQENTHFGDSWSLDGKDFGTGYTVIEETAAISYWQYPLPKEVVHAILNNKVNNTIYIRVRGVSSDGAVGAWTSERKFTISKDVAQFSPFTLGKTAAEANPPAYAPRSVWIKGDSYTLKGKVTHSSGIKTITAKTENAPQGVQSLDITNASTWYTKSSDGSFEFAIPIKTTHYAEKSGEIEFTITAEDNRTGGQSIKSSSHVRLKYDNSIPAAAIGGSIGEKTAQTTFTSGEFTVAKDLDPAKKDQYRVVVNNTRYEIDSIVPESSAASTKKVTLKNAPGLNGIFDYGITERPYILQSTGYQVEGLASDTGSGITKISVTLTVNSKSETIDLTTTDNPKTIISERGDLVSFKGSLNTTKVDNGQGTLKITAYDGAGNEISDEVTKVLVKNDLLSITKLTFKTNLDGNAVYNDDTDEVKQAVLTGSFDAEKDYRGTVDVAQTFTYKDNTKSELTVELTGGYKTARTFELYKDSVSNTNKIAESSPAISGNTYTFNLANNLNTIGDGPARKLILRAFDESVGKLWYAQAEITVNVEHTDSTPPVGVIVPFFYNSDKQELETEKDFKLTSVKYDSAKQEPLGHIELSKIEGLDSNNPANSYPCVSGTVILRGTAYDNVHIKELKLDGAGISNAVITNTAGTWSGDSKFKVTDKHNRKGHYVAWEYEWVTGTPELNKTITLTVTDFANKTNTSAGNTEPTVKNGTRGTEDRAIVLAQEDTAEQYQFMRLTDTKEQSYLVQVHSIEKGNKATWFNVDVPINITKYVLYGYTANNAQMKVNIVPYISKVETALSKLGGNQPDLYARTALGHYPVQDEETIKIHGFNLNGASYTVGSVNAGTVTGSSSPWLLKLASSAVSGKLEATVNTVKAVNNSNENTKLYNKGAKTSNSERLTDDVELDIWQFTSKAALPGRGIITEPVMHINPISKMIGFAFANGPDFFSMSNGTTNSYTKWHKNYDDFGNVDFVYDNHGNAHGVVVGRDINSGSNHGGKFTYMCSKWGVPSHSDGNNYGGSNALRLEAIGQVGSMSGGTEPILDKTRIQHPSLAAVSDSSTSTRLYLAYYDSLNDQIRFKSGINDKTSNNAFGQFTDQETQSAVTAYNQAYVDIVAGTYNTGTTGNATGTYLSLGVVPGTTAANDVVVLIWFDETNRMLKYTYKTTPQTPAHASQTNPSNGGWHVPVTVFDKMNIGEYCKIAVDKKGGIHIAAFDSDAADLKYAYSSTYNATGGFKIATVDAYGITGSYITLDVAYTGSGAEEKAVPYIGYYSASAGRSKLAYLHDTATGVDNAAQGTDASGYFTGKWEVSVVPTTSRVQQDNINVGVWKTNGVLENSTNGTASYDQAAGNKKGTVWGCIYGNGTANPVLGYAIKQAMNGSIETAQKK
ncbi:MAG: Ig-like domain-containing protein, partial [Treponema sp.]